MRSRWFWASFSLPGLGWLALFFLIPFYVIFAVAMGAVDPIFRFPVPVWNPLDWNTQAFETIFAELTPGGIY
ncbi:MAG TPA: hypothetical protein VD704_07835, partial [Gaiellaceae bacterium]|nr:hypothetical protein [Gaiellaceae bacterium]